MKHIQSAVDSLVEQAVEFVIVGGVAIIAHGVPYATFDLDFCYARTPENLKKIVAALKDFSPRLRDFPKDLPFVWDERTLQNGTNFTLETSIGDIDLLGEVAGVGSYKDILENSILMKLFNYEVHVLSLNDLIKAKKAAGRPKDLFVLPQLETLQEALSKKTDEELFQ
jgi:predicted nucleotidyltransferase